MLRRIDIFMPPNVSQYGVLHHFTRKFFEALTRIGVNCRILEAERENPKPFLTKIFSDPPDCTLMFNGLLPDEEGRFFCDLIQVPHVACLVDSPNHYFSLIKSPYTIISCVDLFSCEFFRGMGSGQVLFMPHGVEKNLAHEKPDTERDFDILMLASCIDYEGYGEAWPAKFGPQLSKVMKEACEIAIAEQESPLYQAFAKALNNHLSGPQAIDPRSIDFPAVLDEIEAYIRGKDRVDLLRSITDAPIQLFGSDPPGKGWKYYLQGQDNITIHQPVNYNTALNLMRRSKIVLNSCAWIRNGTHERILSGLACDCLVLTGDNTYMREHFQDGKEILYYSPGNLHEVNEKLNYYLSHPDLLKSIANEGREQVLHGHTWDIRAASLIRSLTPLLENLKQRPG